jgi:hypothetical protein
MSVNNPKNPFAKVLHAPDRIRLRTFSAIGPLSLFLALLNGLCSSAIAAAPVFEIENRRLFEVPAAEGGQHTLTLTLANIGGWNDEDIAAGVGQAGRILATCGIRLARAELLRVRVPDSHRDFFVPRSRELARALALPKPALYFAAGTRQTPAFDAEAIGRGNSRSRPELRDTVWIARGARDPGIVIAHELAHVLADSGAHDNTPGNLMAEATTPDNTRLSAAQCVRITATGTRNGLLQPGVD